MNNSAQGDNDSASIIVTETLVLRRITIKVNFKIDEEGIFVKGVRVKYPPTLWERVNCFIRNSQPEDSINFPAFGYLDVSLFADLAWQFWISNKFTIAEMAGLTHILGQIEREYQYNPPGGEYVVLKNTPSGETLNLSDLSRVVLNRAARRAVVFALEETGLVAANEALRQADNQRHFDEFEIRGDFGKQVSGDWRKVQAFDAVLSLLSGRLEEALLLAGNATDWPSIETIIKKSS